MQSGHGSFPFQFVFSAAILRSELVALLTGARQPIHAKHDLSPPAVFGDQLDKRSRKGWSVALLRADISTKPTKL